MHSPSCMTPNLFGRFEAATVMASSTLAGDMVQASALLLPDATITGMPLGGGAAGWKAQGWMFAKNGVRAQKLAGGRDMKAGKKVWPADRQQRSMSMHSCALAHAPVAEGRPPTEATLYTAAHV